jgi:hypothetical protein
MAGNEFKEWPEVQSPSGTHGGQTPMTYDFPLAEVNEADVEDASRRLSIGGAADAAANATPGGFVYRHRRELVAVVSIAVVAAAVSGVSLGLRNRVDSQKVLSSCQQSVDIYQSSVERLKKTVDGVDEDLNIEENQVLDSQTVTDLHEAVDKANEETDVNVSCDASASVEDNQASDEELTAATRELGNKVEAILSAKTAVERSKTARDTAVAKTELVDKVTEGQSVLANVNSRDLNARQDLSVALNEAQQVATTSTSGSPSTYTDQMQELQEAIDKYSSTAE